MEILDQETDQKSSAIKKSKLLNSIVILLLLLFLIYTAFRVISDYFYYQSSYNVLLPSYSFIYVNAILLNSTIVLLFGLLPIIYFRFKGKYFLSSSCTFVFAFLALIFGNTIELYTVLYYFI